jgi:hypothetical protein
MTYISRTTRKKRHRRPQQSLGGILDILDPWGLVHEGGVFQRAIVGPASAECEAAGKEKTAGMEQRRLDLAKTWHPTGYYTLSDAQQLITGALHTLDAAMSAVTESLGDFQLDGHKDALTQIKGTILSKMDKAQPFQVAINAAQQQGINILDAPGLQRYVMDTMRDVEWATESIAYIACMRPFWVAVVGVIEQALDVLWTIAKAVAGVIAGAGDLVMKVPDFAHTLFTVAKYGALAFGVYWVATGGPKKLLAKGKSSSRP